MEGHNHRIIELIGKLRAGTATPEDIQELDAWYASFDGADGYIAGLTDDEQTRLKERNFRKIMKHVGNPRLVERSSAAGQRFRGVAIGLLLATLIMVGYYTWQSHMPAYSVQSGLDALPGGNKATLTLSDGRQINLDSLKSGYLAVEHGTQIMKSPNGEVVYGPYGQTGMPDVHAVAPRDAYNTITTPAGGQYAIVLPDGTKVWMNAASSLRYPTRFSGQTRVVELQGEAYFAVKPMPDETSSSKIPFIVKTRHYEVTVVGTEFNINAYDDEASVRTTLVSGQVDIILPGTKQKAIERITLRPNEQATMRNGAIDVEEVDVMTAIGWKDGSFYFNNTDLYTLVRQFARWYDVEAVYAPGVKNDVFSGRIPRNYTLSEAMKVLELGDVHFQIVPHPSSQDTGRKQLVLEP